MEKSTDDLAAEKLRLEIEKLKSPWYKNIELWKIIIPTFAIIISLYFTFGKGVLDSQKGMLELQKEQLKLEILNFNNEKRDIIKSIESSRTELNETNEQVVQHKIESDSLSKQVKLLNRAIEQQKSNLQETANKLTRDKSYYIEELLKGYALEKNRLVEISKLRDTISNLRDDQVVKALEINYHKLKNQLTKEEENELSELLDGKRNELRSLKISKYNKEIERIEKDFKTRSENERKRFDTLSSEEFQRYMDLFFLRRYGVKK